MLAHGRDEIPMPPDKTPPLGRYGCNEPQPGRLFVPQRPGKRGDGEIAMASPLVREMQDLGEEGVRRGERPSVEDRGFSR